MNKLWVRLSLAFAGVVLIAVLIVMVSGSILRQFEDDQYKFTKRILGQTGGLIENLGTYYQTHNDWAGVESMLIGAQTMRFRPEVAFVLADSEQQVIYHMQPEVVGVPLSQTEPVLVLPIEVDHKTVGYLGLEPLPEPPRDDRFSPPVIRVLVDVLPIIALVGGIGGIIFGVLISRSLTAPLNDLAQAAKAIGARHLNQRVEAKGSDEIIAVARAFNEMAADLEQAEQLRRNMLADVAHELRTPLTVLQGNLRAILDEVFPCDNTEMARLYEHTRFLSRLVNDLHELAQAEAGQLSLDLQETDLADLVRTTADTFRPSAEAKGVSLQTDLPADLSPIQVDAGRLRQVLQNLLSNALRHTPAGGTIMVRVEPTPKAVCLSIADTGEGIPPEHLPHIFDRFYRTDPARSRDRGGAGLGLAIARAIIEAHGGRVTVASEGVPGKGSTFTIQLPLDKK